MDSSLALLEFHLYISLTLAEPLTIILDFDYCCCYLLLYIAASNASFLDRDCNVDFIPGCGIVIYVASTSAWSVHQTSELSIESVYYQLHWYWFITSHGLTKHVLPRFLSSVLWSLRKRPAGTPLVTHK